MRKTTNKNAAGKKESEWAFILKVCILLPERLFTPLARSHQHEACYQEQSRRRPQNRAGVTRK
jgi:hypothetical protein